MKKYKLLLFLLFISLPSLILSSLNVLVDPYNYHSNFNLIDNNLKNKIAGKTNYPLWKLLSYNISKENSIILGDSRMDSLNIEDIKKINSQSYYNLSYGGGTIPEAISTFYYVSSNNTLKTVIFGIDILNFNSNQRLNRVKSAINIIKNPYKYYTNFVVTYTTFLEIYYSLVNISPELELPNLSQDKFWKKELVESIPQMFYNYKYPFDLIIQLNELSKYCKDRNIDLIFVIPPMHDDALDAILNHNMKENIVMFKRDLSKISKVIDLSDRSQFTKNRENFKDPFHFKNTEYIINNIFH